MVQALDNPEGINECSGLARHFTFQNRLCTNMSLIYEEIHLIFDRCDVTRSIKTSTRDRH